MSERKSWDVVPNRAPKREPQPAERPAARAHAPKPKRQVRVDDMRPARQAERAAPQQARPAPAVRRPTTPQRRPSGERLKERRRRERKALRIALAVILVAMIAAAFYALWLPTFRISDVRAASDDQSAADAARLTLTGTYAHLIPHDSILFFPKEKMREAILAAYPNVAAVSISRSSLHSILITTTPRAKAFLWCGTAIDTPYPDGCFDADGEGLVFAQSDESASASTTAATTTRPTGELRIFSPLDPELAAGDSPVRHHATSASSIPNALRFIKAVRGFGASVSALALRGDEADLWIGSKTRITYVLGHEEEAGQLAASVLPKLSLNDGSIQYVDLRFTGKAYVKRYGQQ